MMTEQEIEESFIRKLTDIKYVYRRDIHSKLALEKNFREKFQTLNQVNLSDSEFARLCDEIVTDDVFKAAKRLRNKNTFIREDGTPLQYTLVNIKEWCKNDFEVINQLRINTDNSYHRYDVIILINGIPVVQIELKTLQISPRRAIEQIVQYKKDSKNGYTNSLLCFMQLFIVSNRTETLYFANNHNKHFKFNANECFLPIYKLANKQNKQIMLLDEFTDKFLGKCDLGQMISRYMVLVASEQKLIIMRPYQIYAVKAIIDCVNENRGNGFIWHTTGSGKTLTSFKASTLLKDNPDIEKCLFVVDRKDLDRQTREEFNKFQEGCVEENTNTETLVKRMLSTDHANKVIVTTIQKLGLALDENSKHNKKQKEKGKLTYKERLKPLHDKRIVFIFDECHRSQFGENHKSIKEFFPNAQVFGFTGTPIFEENATYKQSDGTEGSFITTEIIFDQELHKYTITHAIEDKNVLGFHIDYFGKNDKKKKIKKEKTTTPKATPTPKAVIKEILLKHDSATNNRRFNAILATGSINNAIEYFEQFKVIQTQKKNEDKNFKPLNIACVFSPPTQTLSKNNNENQNDKNTKDIRQLQEDLLQEKEDNKVEPEKKKAALIKIINDYNNQYGTNHSINEFDGYYQDVQQRIKDQKYDDYSRKNKIDIMIVVDMLLTGFDSHYLNTLYVDKNLKFHGLIQAYSRTNRVLNDTKPWGNILDFRGQEDQVNAAIKLFAGKGKSEEQAKEIWLVDPAPVVVEKLKGAINDLDTFMKSEGLDCVPEQVANLKGDKARAQFIIKFKEIQRFKTQLDQYTDLDEDDKNGVEAILSQDALRAFKCMYLETAQNLKCSQSKDYDNIDKEVLQLDFELVLFSSAIIDYDYIIELIAKGTQNISKQKMNHKELIEQISSTSNLMYEREDIIGYINSLKTGEILNTKEIHDGIVAFKYAKSANELANLAKKYGLGPQAVQSFIDDIMNRMIFDGEKLSDLLAPLELGWKARIQKELVLMKDLIPILKKMAEGREISGLTAYE